MLTKWLLTLFGYDGLLPALVLLIPAAMFWLGLPLGFIEATGVILPVFAFIFRLIKGLQTILSNDCSPGVRAVQKVLLCAALFPLAVVDAFAILTWRIPAGALTLEDYLFACGIYTLYVSLMAVVTYPGRRK